MASRRKNRKKPGKRQEARPVRTILSVLGILGFAFAGLTQFATPATEQELTDGFPASHIAHSLPKLDRNEIQGRLFGGSSIADYAARMRASQAKPQFAMGDLHIGMSFADFREVSAGKSMIKAMKSGVLGVLNTDQHRFNTYFPDHSEDATAHRLAYHRTFHDRSEREITEYLGELWGKPTSTTCRRLILERGEDCVYSWWPINGVHLTAQVRKTEEAVGQPAKITLRLDAINDQTGKRRVRATRLAAYAN